MNRHIRSNVKAGSIITVVQELPAPEDGGQNPMQYTLSAGATSISFKLKDNSLSGKRLYAFLLCFSLFFFSQLFVRPLQIAILLFYISFPWGWS